MENAYNISFAFLFLSLLLVIYIPFCIFIYRLYIRV
ncbi:putative membrane protein, partial [Escherichia coli FRIK1990]